MASRCAIGGGVGARRPDLRNCAGRKLYNVKEVANHLALTSARLQGLFAPPHCSADDVANPNNVDPEVLLVCGLAHACADSVAIDPKLRDMVRESTLGKAGDNYLPALGLLPSSSTAANGIGSIFGGDRISLLEPWIAPEAYASIRRVLSNAPQVQTIDALKMGCCEMWMSSSAVLWPVPLASGTDSERGERHNSPAILVSPLRKTRELQARLC